jgi:hypothetical protein
MICKNWKGRNKVSLVEDNMIYNTKMYKLLELTSEFRKIAENKGKNFKKEKMY